MNKFSVIREIDDVGRIVIPKQLREHCNIKPNDIIEFQIVDDKTIKLFSKDNKIDKGKTYMDNDLIRKTDVLQMLYDLKKDISDNKTPVNYGTILDIIYNVRYMDSADTKNENSQVIYTITMLEKIESDKKGWPNFGSTNIVGYYTDLAVAIEAVTSNACDINETVYDYAVIEKVSEGLYHPSVTSYWFKYNRAKDSYEPIDVPDELKHICGFSIG
jgi:AbrB family looped-hinge helix DNA binding protein